MRRLAVIPAVLSLSVLGLTACGSDEPVSEGSVKISGEFGSAPKVTFADTPLKREKSVYKTLSAGEGATVKEGDLVTVDYYIGNGYNGEKAESTFDDGGQPAQLKVSKAQLALPALYTAIVDHKVGSRVSVIAAPKDALAAVGGNDQLGIGNQDTIVLVIDIIKVLAPKDVEASEVPRLLSKGGVPSGFDFAGASKAAPKDLLRATLKPGTGAVVKSGQTVQVEYLGSVYGSKKVFDQSFSKGKDPISVAVGQGGVITGWDIGLVGTKVGSRIELVIPGDLAYGAQGREPDIKPNDTLVFVMDIVSAS